MGVSVLQKIWRNQENCPTLFLMYLAHPPIDGTQVLAEFLAQLEIHDIITEGAESADDHVIPVDLELPFRTQERNDLSESHV